MHEQKGLAGSAQTEPRPKEAPEDAQLDVLRLLAERSDVSQRELAQLLGLSLGKTHYLLHALLDRGLVKAANFRRSDRKWAYAYVLTPVGMKEKLRLTRSFLARKEAEFELLERTIKELRAELSTNAEPAQPCRPTANPLSLNN